ncbi:alpha/beta hydrolase fold domain-containing protein [Pantoea sp. App145]|uniref:alpha/beta hydrolase fold domain-containing protein n=1 Tax=Pantoea sp. App145 TaxID=3071567 RepID=UPI003A7F9337
MSQHAYKPLETRHPLSAHDRTLEPQIIAAMDQLRANFSGTMREMYDQMLAGTPMAPGIVTERIDQDGIQGWWVKPEQQTDSRAVVFIHGGGYTLGSAIAYRGFASQLATRTGIATFVPDYPLTPEHPFPAAPKALARIPGWLATQGMTQLTLVGDSAGGALVLGLLQNPQVAADVASAVVFSPYLDLAFTGDSFNNPATHDPIFHPEILTQLAGIYLNGTPATNGLASPLYDVPERLPPLAIQVGTDELLLDDATRYAAAAAVRGDEVRLDIYEGMHHVFQSEIELEAARHALDAAAEFITRHWR